MATSSTGRKLRESGGSKPHETRPIRGISKPAIRALEASGISTASLTPSASRQQDRAPVLRRVADDRDDHDRDEERREVRSVREGPECADERFGDEGGHQCRDAEHDEGGSQGPAVGCELSGRIELPLRPKRVPGHGHADDQEQYGERNRELGKRAAVRVAVEPRRCDGEDDEG